LSYGIVGYLGHNSLIIGHSWNVLPLGCGGFVTGMFIANDGSMVCRTDVGNGYRFSGLTTDYANPAKQWVPLLNYTSLAGQGPAGGDPVCNDNPGMWEHVLAPNHSNVHGAIFPDMQGDGAKGWFWSGTWNGATVPWVKSNLAFLNQSVSPNYNMKLTQQKVSYDPANPNIVVVGCPSNDGNSAGAYTSLNKAGGSSLATLVSVKTSGTTPVPDTVACSYMPHGSSASAGIAFDASSGTSVKFGGQTVTNRIIIPIPGSGIYESTDGGDTYTEIAAGPLGTADFYVPTGFFTAEGVYYCVLTNATIGGVYRYKAGTWTKISTGISYLAADYFDGAVSLTVDPRNNPTSKAYLSVWGPNGFGVGFSSANANTGSPPTWTGTTGGQLPTMKSASYDIPYINQIFGGAGVGSTPPYFVAANGAQVDLNGVCWWPGNQSLFYVSVSASDPTPAVGPPIYSNTGSANIINSQSMGRGMESTVAEDVVRPPGGPYPVLAVQDLGAPMRGTYTTYPLALAVPFQEWTCECVEFAANESNFIIARTTGQSGAGAIIDASKYSTTYGSDGSWTALAAYPVYNASITASISNGSGGAGFILNVTACSGIIRETASIADGNLDQGDHGIVQPYGTSGTTGTGGTGTYILDTSSFVASGPLFSVQFVQGGQTVAIDRDHWLTVPSGFGGQSYVPTFTANATGAATWVDTNLPSHQWTERGWTFGAASKPFAVGNGSALGTMWALKFPKGASGTATLYRNSTAYNPTSFASIATFSIGISTGVYCQSVPGFPNDLWLSGLFTGGNVTNTGLWHVTNANSASPTITLIAIPVAEYFPVSITLGAPDTPGGYPSIYLLANTGFNTPKHLYKGTVSGGGNNPSATISWVLYGPTGGAADLPLTCQLQGIQSIRGDWDVPGLIYAPTAGCGLAYYNP
jgi:hypothetical protein